MLWRKSSRKAMLMSPWHCRDCPDNTAVSAPKNWMFQSFFFFFFLFFSVFTHFWALSQILCALPSLAHMVGIKKLNKVSDSNGASPDMFQNGKLLHWFSFGCFHFQEFSISYGFICCNCDSKNLLSFPWYNKILDREELTMFWSQPEVELLMKW